MARFRKAPLFHRAFFAFISDLLRLDRCAHQFLYDFRRKTLLRETLVHFSPADDARVQQSRGAFAFPLYSRLLTDRLCGFRVVSACKLCRTQCSRAALPYENAVSLVEKPVN